MRRFKLNEERVRQILEQSFEATKLQTLKLRKAHQLQKASKIQKKLFFYINNFHCPNPHKTLPYHHFFPHKLHHIPNTPFILPLFGSIHHQNRIKPPIIRVLWKLRVKTLPLLLSIVFQFFLPFQSIISRSLPFVSAVKNCKFPQHRF
jgi:hypothetical protein